MWYSYLPRCGAAVHGNGSLTPCRLYVSVVSYHVMHVHPYSSSFHEYLHKRPDAVVHNTVAVHIVSYVYAVVSSHTL